MDPISIALGVLPLVGGAIKTYKAIHKRLKVFRHYSREVRRIQKQLDRQLHFFVNETHLFLRFVVHDENAIQDMLKDGRDNRWESKELERSTLTVLGNNYNPYQEIIEEIQATMKGLQDELHCFDVLSPDTGSNEPVKEAIRRLRDRVKITWNKSKLEELVKELKASNDDLRRLRNQALELNNPGIASSAATSITTIQQPRKRPEQEYSQFTVIQRASKALHGAFECAWSRTTPSTKVLQHTVRLFLDTEVKGEVFLRVIISCLGDRFSQSNIIREERLARFTVRSKLREWADTSLSILPSKDDSHEPVENNRRKRRKVRFTQDKDIEDSTKSTPFQTSPLTTSEPEDLCTKDICSVLCQPPTCNSQKNKPDPTEQAPVCLGYVDTCSQETLRHSFYASTTLEETCTPDPTISSMSQVVLSHPIETSLTIVDQLKLAHNLASAVLKFHSTPWLKEYFSLSDLFIFYANGHNHQKQHQDLSTCLQTLHLGLNFTQPPTPSLDPPHMPSTDCTMEGVDKTNTQDEIQTAKLQYGVRNLTLWSLGTALLQIGRWSQKTPALDDVLAIRKLISSTQVPTLGPKYKELTKKCLDCDFGYGDDLSKPRLQQAVYENLICELGGMITSLDIT